jgi:hypothetical protein
VLYGSADFYVADFSPLYVFVSLLSRIRAARCPHFPQVGLETEEELWVVQVTLEAHTHLNVAGTWEVHTEGVHTKVAVAVEPVDDMAVHKWADNTAEVLHTEVLRKEALHMEGSGWANQEHRTRYDAAENWKCQSLPANLQFQ